MFNKKEDISMTKHWQKIFQIFLICGRSCSTALGENGVIMLSASNRLP